MATETQTTRSMEAAERLRRALGHPLRMRVLMRLNQSVRSPVQLAAELEEPLNTVAYHVRVLLDLGFLELVSTAPRRGATEHFYRAQERALLTDEDWATLPDATRAQLSASVLQQIWSDVSQAVARGSFDAEIDRHLSNTPLALDRQGWEELGVAAIELVETAIRLQAESANRVSAAEGDVEVLPVRLAILGYTGPGPAA
ncbi:MAG TPA: helix-turn-helix domain-containing protein [Solirubrobacteraceae bacterium]|nr:helix-turn-helix domain-containing protein [Solirubrobacteraceae bacterium]